MADLKIDFNNCDVNIDKMFDIHDNQNVNLYNSVTHNKSKSTKPKVKNEKHAVGKPQTLKYYKHDNNGELMKQHKRVDIVFRKFREWGWIDNETSPDDFDALFEGSPRHCNVIWTANVTVLTVLLQELLKQEYIIRQTGCSAKSLVKAQFGKTANSDRTRLNDIAEERIKITLLILNTNNPLPENKRSGSNEEYDIQDAALMEIYSGQLRKTKGI